MLNKLVHKATNSLFEKALTAFTTLPAAEFDAKLATLSKEAKQFLISGASSEFNEAEAGKVELSPERREALLGFVEAITKTLG